MRFFAASLSASILPRRLIEPVLSRTSAISIAMMPRGTSARASRSTILRPRKPPKIVGSVAAASTAMRSELCVTLKRVTAMPPSGRNAASKIVARELCEIPAAFVERVPPGRKRGAVDRRLEIGLHPRAARVLDRGAGDDEERHERHREQDRDRAAPVAGKCPEHGASLFHDSPS